MSKKTGDKRTSNEASTTSTGNDDDYDGMDCRLQPKDFLSLPTKPALQKKTFNYINIELEICPQEDRRSG